MRTSVIILFLFLCTITVSGQKSKKVEIWRKPMTKEIINAHYYYNKDNTHSYLTIHFTGQDSRYQQLIEYITLFSGSPVEFYSFLTELDAFWKENDTGTSMTIHNHRVTYDKLMGVDGLWVYEEDGNGYRSLNAKHINKFKQKFISWCEANNVIYNK